MRCLIIKWNVSVYIFEQFYCNNLILLNNSWSASNITVNISDVTAESCEYENNGRK